MSGQYALRTYMKLSKNMLIRSYVNAGLGWYTQLSLHSGGLGNRIMS